ncbi:MAG: molybdopterin-dependent oxidoreductase [Anaerolineales bacterium]
MKRNRYLLAAGLGAITSLPVIALTFLGEALFGLPIVPFDIFDWVGRTLPGGVITFGIDSMVALIRGLNLGETSSTAKLLEQMMAISQLVIGGAVFGVILAWLAGRRQEDKGLRDGLIGGSILLLVTIAIEAALGAPSASWTATTLWLGVLFLGWGALLARSVQVSLLPAETEEEPMVNRRGFLQLVGGGSLAAALTAIGITRLLDQAQPTSTAAVPQIDSGDTSGPAASPAEDVLAGRIEPAPGTRPELSSNEDFYRIDINTLPPELDANDWRLKLDGMVDNPMTMTIEDILNRPSFTQVVTMQCISNPVGGDLTGTSRWTGISLGELLDDAGLQDGAKEVYIESADGFYESVSLEDAYDGRTLLVYAMNGQPLPVEHGFPLRIYMANRYGMKQPKWIVHMAVVGEEKPGYWVERGWSKEAFARTVSVVDTVALDSAEATGESVPVGGIAWAGDRGISKVEIRVDEGDWHEAELRVPPLSPLTWVQWRYDWPRESGTHTFAVRAYDGNGEMQVLESNPPRPDGATGLHTLRVRA